MSLKSIKVNWNKGWLKSLFYTLLVVFFCVVDQRRGSADGRVQFVFVNLEGAAVCLVMFTAYRWKDFVRLPYLLWSGFFAVAAGVVTYLRLDVIMYRGQWYTALLNVWLMGLLAIRLVVAYAVEKRRSAFDKRALALFVVTMVLFCVSRNDSLWPLWYLGLFGMLYLTDFTAEDRKSLLNAVENGVIVSFFLIQGLAFVFRPYDALRYPGMYFNANMTALMYSLVYGAFMGKYCRYVGRDREVKHCRLIRTVILLFCGAMWTFVGLTMCRSAFLGMLAVTGLAGLYCLRKGNKKILRNALGMGCGLALCIVLCAPPVYCAVRYLPAVFHHPIWFLDEYAEWKVHSWDPIDSPKYISWEIFLEELLGRWREIDLSKLITEGERQKPIYVASVNQDYLVAKMLVKQEPVLAPESVNSVSVRKSIFEGYWHFMNLQGHKNAENGFQLTEDYKVPHAHNFFLQMSFNFGIPAGILFFAWIFWAIGVAAKKVFGKSADAGNVTMLLLYTAAMVFGLFEIMWLTGQMSFTLLFLMPVMAFEKRKKVEP